MSDSLWHHRLQHTTLPCPSPTCRAYSNSCPSSQWCHSTISPSVVPFSFHLQSSSASESFPMSQFFASHGQSIGVSASASVLPMTIQDWFPLGWTGCISLLSKGLTSLLQHHSSKASVLQCSAFLTIYGGTSKLPALFGEGTEMEMCHLLKKDKEGLLPLPTFPLIINCSLVLRGQYFSPACL